jgi:hypothetical protein
VLEGLLLVGFVVGTGVDRGQRGRLLFVVQHLLFEHAGAGREPGFGLRGDRDFGLEFEDRHGLVGGGQVSSNGLRGVLRTLRGGGGGDEILRDESRRLGVHVAGWEHRGELVIDRSFLGVRERFGFGRGVHWDFGGVSDLLLHVLLLEDGRGLPELAGRYGIDAVRG